MRTFGFATPTLGTARGVVRTLSGKSSSGASPPANARVGYTSSKTDSFRDNSSLIGAESSPIVIAASAVVTPILAKRPSGWQLPASSVSSATIAPGRGLYQLTVFRPIARNPMSLPKDIFITASAMPFSTAQAAFTFPFLASLQNSAQAKLISPVVHPLKRYTGCPASLNSGVMTSFA